ncbi:DUF402 domain-containing protein [Nakamurella sp. DB0629]|uniref:DUF402 domain-containing protein n=1 Tax=Nakamurella aerolata TaxID=1656892 RepID=A0A849A6Q9_9ACTN|nr:DUF402 domain-containing protein [Nakamurella aerolata]
MSEPTRRSPPPGPEQPGPAGGTQSAPTPVRVRSRKWDGTPHRDNWTWQLGSDEYGRWLWMPDNTPVLTSRETYPETFSAVAGLRFFPHDAAGAPRTDWSAFMVPAHAARQRPQQLYCDVTCALSAGQGLIEFIDLDLDVEQLGTGPVRVLDDDEFETRRRAMRYPEPVAQRARTTAAELVRLMRRPAEPFAGRWRSWLRLAAAGDYPELPAPATVPA